MIYKVSITSGFDFTDFIGNMLLFIIPRAYKVRAKVRF